VSAAEAEVVGSSSGSSGRLSRSEGKKGMRFLLVAIAVVSLVGLSPSEELSAVVLLTRLPFGAVEIEDFHQP